MFNGVLLLKPTASQEKVQITTTFTLDVEYNMHLKSPSLVYSLTLQHPLHILAWHRIQQRTPRGDKQRKAEPGKTFTKHELLFQRGIRQGRSIIEIFQYADNAIPDVRRRSIPKKTMWNAAGTRADVQESHQK